MWTRSSASSYLLLAFKIPAFFASYLAPCFALSGVATARDSLRRILFVDDRHIGKLVFEIPPSQTMTSMRLWHGWADVRMLLVSDKYLLSDSRKKGGKWLKSS